MDLQTSVSYLFGVGEKYAKLLDIKLNIKTVEDLLNHFPQRYEDFSHIKKFSEVQTNEIVTVIGKISDVKSVYTARIKIQRIFLTDENNQIAEITFFNQPFLVQSLKKGVMLAVAGCAEKNGSKLYFKSPEYEVIKNPDVLVHTGRLVPIYPETSGISSKWLRARIFPLINNLPELIHEYLDNDLLLNENLIDLISAYKNIHYPDSHESLAKANFRLAFDELLMTQLKARERKKMWSSEKTKAFKIEHFQKEIQKFIGGLPFTLTASQNRSVEEISADLANEKPMNRLLEGDVGSGKTVVAAIAMYLAWLNGYSSALMCPTEILANQHFTTINKLLNKFNIPICLITASASKNTSSDKNIIANNNQGIFIGTHALIEEKVNIPNLNLVVIDEQHRFGVEQRGKLIKKGAAPHVLTMTATPIPRTIALTFYGDLDLSTLEELPQKKQIKTWVVPAVKRARAYEWIQNEIKKTKSQAFIVCPFISPSETMESVKSATQEFEKLKTIFTHLRLALLTGKTKSKEKDDLMKKFSRGEFSILVATPVVEVGIDIAGASIILIEGAERFGLAQLHQLRGRVGRRGQSAYCLLFTTDNNSDGVRRLKNLETVSNGIKLAEIDLKIRGIGNIFGKEQHGIMEFKKANISDLYLVEKTKTCAGKIFEDIDDYPVLKNMLKNSKITNIVNN